MRLVFQTIRRAFAAPFAAAAIGAVLHRETYYFFKNVCMVLMLKMAWNQMNLKY